MKAVKEKLPEDRVSDFEKGAQAYAKKIVANFKDYEFVGISQPSSSDAFKCQSQFTGESMNPDGMVALLNYREDGITRKCKHSIKLSISKGLLSFSVFHFLERWCQGSKTLSSPFVSLLCSRSISVVHHWR
jgi:Translationally controlled tumour protein